MSKLIDKIFMLTTYYKELYSLVPLNDFFKKKPWVRALFPYQTITRRIRQIGCRPLKIRLETSDYATLKSTFLHQFHLPHKRLKDKPTILDLGSNVGYTVVDLAYHYPGAKIIGVEMDYENFQCALANTRDIDNCLLLNNALSVATGTVAYSNSHCEDSYKIQNDIELGDANAISIDAITIKNIIDEYDIKSIDYIKMDIEGEEVKVFDEGQSDLSWLGMVDSLNIEVHTSLSDLENIIAILQKHNFIAWKDDRHWSSVIAVRV